MTYAVVRRVPEKMKTATFTYLTGTALTMAIFETLWKKNDEYNLSINPSIWYKKFYKKFLYSKYLYILIMWPVGQA